MENIRKQYEKRSRSCVLGTPEAPIEWATLGLSSKVSGIVVLRNRAPLSLRQVQIIYELCEIQLEDPARFRGLLKSEDDATSWVSCTLLHEDIADSLQRVDPAGWDKYGNTYFLFDGKGGT